MEVTVLDDSKIKETSMWRQLQVSVGFDPDPILQSDSQTELMCSNLPVNKQINLDCFSPSPPQLNILSVGSERRSMTERVCVCVLCICWYGGPLAERRCAAPRGPSLSSGSDDMCEMRA